MKEILSSIRWGWAFIGAAAAQVALIPTVYVIFAFTSGWGWQHVDLLLIRVAYVLIPFVAGAWAARKARGHFTANGVTLGLFTAIAYLPVLLVAPPPYPGMEVIAAALKIVGGALGGGLVGHRRRRRTKKLRR
jgi:hypothetical protein